MGLRRMRDGGPGAPLLRGGPGHGGADVRLCGGFLRIQ